MADDSLYAFLVRHKWRLVLKIAFLLSPLVMAIVVAVTMGGGFDALDLFSSIGSNVYALSNLLLLFLLAAQLMVFFNLVLYAPSLLRTVERGGEQRAVRWLVACIGGLILTTLFIYFSYVFLASAGVIKENHSWFVLESLFVAGRFIALGLLFSFLVMDLLLYFLHRLWSENSLGSQREHEHNSADLALLSVLFVDIPALSLAGFATWLGYYLHSREAFRRVRDLDFPQHLVVHEADREALVLFVQGLDAGIFIALLAVSQLAFLGLQIRWQYRGFTIAASSSG